jgi:hypothetical protein
MSHRPIVGFEMDEVAHWCALLGCGHLQHVRHDPPLTSRDWVLNEQGRRSRLGFQLKCRKCEQGAPRDRELFLP